MRTRQVYEKSGKLVRNKEEGTVVVRLSLVLSTLLIPWAFLPWASSAQGPEGPVRFAPEIVKDPDSIGIGRCVPDRELTDIAGNKVQLAELAKKTALVIVARDTGCPLCKRYGPRLRSLEKQFAGQVRFVFLNSTEHNTTEEMRSEQEKYGFEGPYIVDRAGTSLGKQLGVRSTAEVFLIDQSRTILYRGAVDDQYGIGYARKEVRTPLLANAIRDMIAAREVAVPATTAPGCVLDLGPGQFDVEAPTYHGRVSRIMQRACLDCHRQGAAGLPLLENYTQVKGTRAMIAEVVRQEIMPPWFAKEGTGPWRRKYPFTASDRKDLLRWIAAGAPEGDPKDAPVAKKRPGPWSIGKPDLVLAKRRPFDVPAEGVIDYQYTFVKNTLSEDRWVEKIEIRPSAPQVVHHVLVFLEEPRRPGETRAQHQKRTEEGLEGYFAAMVPGMTAIEFRPGHAKLLPAGAWLKIQTHYTTNGEPAANRTEIGFKFASKPPLHTVRTASAYNNDFKIPAGAANHEVQATYEFKDQATLLSFSPHMHLRGKAFRYQLIYPDGRKQTLLDIPRYDFNWQLRYVLEKPIPIPRGARLEATAWFDNSDQNPANPAPEKPVGFGLQTWDEMMIGYFDWYRDES